MKNKISRRDLLKVAGASAAAGALSSLPFIPSQATLRALAQAACEMDWTPLLADFGPKYDPPMQITVPYTVRDDVPLPEGASSIFDLEIFGIWRDHLGMEFPAAWESAGGDLRNNRLLADLAAGSLPDFFAVDNQQLLSQLIDADAAEDITDIFEATASELVKTETNYPDGDMWLNVRRGNRIYGIAWTGAAYNHDSQSWIRRDWLEQLDLTEPTTIDELTEVLRAFVSNGLSEIGIANQQNIFANFYGLSPIFGAYGVMPAIWRENPDGTLRYGSLDAGVRDALAQLNAWYTEGLMDADFFTRTADDAVANMINGTAGVCFGPHYVNFTTREKLVALDPNTNLDTMPAPLGPNGMRGRRGSGLRGNAGLMRKGLEPAKIEAMVRFTNWMAEMASNIEVYQQYTWQWMTPFTQGYNWVFDENCNVITGPYHAGAVHGTYYDLAYVGFLPRLSAKAFEEILSWRDQDPATLNGAQKYLISDPIFLDSTGYYLRGVQTRDENMEDRWLGQNTERMTELLPALQTLEQTAFVDFIIGNRSLDEFEAFGQEWLAEGGDQVTEDVNTWKASLG